MVDALTIGLLAVAIAASFFAAWTIGAGSTGSTPFAPAVGANAISIMRATFVVGLLGFAGAVLQGGAITETIGAGLIRGTTLSPLGATVALTIGAICIAAGVFKGYPIATAFAISGSVVGVGLAMGGDPAWGTYTEIVLYWIITPIAVTPAAYATTRLLRSEQVPESRSLGVLAALVGAVIANMEFLLLGPSGEEASMATVISGTLPGSLLAGQVLVTLFFAGVFAAVVTRATQHDPVTTQRRFLLFLGAILAFTAGGGKVGLAVGPLLPLLSEVWEGVTVGPVLVFGGIGMLLGTWMVASRMVKALSQDYSDLGPRRSIGILIPSFIIAQIGIFYGLPMAFNQIFISAIAGTGLAVGSAGVSRKKFGYTALAWIASLILSLGVGYGVYIGASTLLGTA